MVTVVAVAVLTCRCWMRAARDGVLLAVMSGQRAGWKEGGGTGVRGGTGNVGNRITVVVSMVLSVCGGDGQC